MKFLKYACFLFIAIFTLPFITSAASFTDDMPHAQSSAVIQYQNLKPYQGVTAGLSDTSMLTFSNSGSPLGHVTYRVNGAESITVGIYTLYGTCVSQRDSGLYLGPGTKQAAWSRAGNSIHADFGDSFHRIELDNRFDPMFVPANAMPPDVLGFGLNIYASPSLNKPLPATVTKSISESFCYEEYTAWLPTSAQYVKVEINNVTSYPIKDGGTMPNLTPTFLASVKISGEALVMGEPAAVSRQPDSLPASSQTPPKASANGTAEDEEISKETLAAAELAKVNELTDGEAYAASNEKSSSSKFEGTITSSSKAEKSQSPSRNTGAKSEDSSQKSESTESPPVSETPSRDLVYEVRRENSGGALSSGITAYIIFVTGMLALFLIFGKRR